MSRAGSFAFSPDGKTVAVSEGCTIHLYDLATGKECMTWPGHRREVTSIAFANDGQSLVSGGSEGAVYLWRNFDGSKPQLLAENMGYIFNVTFAPGRSLLAASGWDGVRLWDTKTGKLTATKQEDSFRTGRVQFFPDGKTLLVAGDWQLAWLWSIDTDKVRRYNEGRIFLTGGSLTIFNTAALSPDGKALLEFGLSMPGIVRDPETGEERSTVSNEAIQFGSGSVRFAPDSKTLVLSNSVWRERKVFFVDVATSAVLRSSNVLKDFSPTTFAFSPDGHTVAVGGYDGSIILLEYSTGGTRLRFRGHIGEINELAFSPDGKRLASASGDGTILLWQLDRLPGLAADQRPLNNKRLQALWNDLGSADANVAYRAIHRLRQDSKNSSTALIEQIHNLWKHDKKVVGQLIVDLASEKYAVRSKATTQLEAMQDAAALELHNALQGNPPLETALRLKALLKKLNGSTPLPRQLQVLRAMEVLEHAATADGKKWFQEMANNTSETYLTREARLAWKRLEGK
jgi:WD40 repeat protein